MNYIHMFETHRINMQNRLDISIKGTLPNDAVCYDKHIDIKINLKRHQLQMLHKMIQLEECDIDLNDNEFLQTEMGILGNKVGSGKSFCILSLIIQKPRLHNRPFVKSKLGNSISVIRKRNNCDIKGGNLIVSPHHIMKSTWEYYLNMFTNLSYYVINNKSFPIDLERICEYDVVLCNAKNYNTFIKCCNFTWSRVIFDEVDTISIPACICPDYRFVWFVSSSLPNLLFPNGYYSFSNSNNRRISINGLNHHGFIKDTFRSIEHSTITDNTNTMLSHIFLKQSDIYVDQIIELPQPLEIYHKCKSPNYVHVLSNFVGIEMLNRMNAGNYEGCLEYMGCTVDTKDNIITIICKDLNEKVENLDRKIDYLSSLTIRDSERETHVQKIEKTKLKKNEIIQRIQDINKKLDDLDIDQSNESCPICFDILNKNSIMLNCCKNIFCMKCIGNIMLYSNNTTNCKCPICRTIFNKSDLLHIRSTPLFKHELQTKEESLVKLINDNIDSKFLIFSAYDQSWTNICLLLDHKNINYSKLVGNQNVINSTLEKFNNGEKNILLLNAQHFGCGLNLTTATDLVFFHKMNAELKRQVIGRAQRIGRTTPLRIHYLYHENEFD